jgi:uncharacterized protein YbcV (DUF1398 family)
MFTLEQIQEAHAKARTGAEFPGHILTLIRLGIRGYCTFVGDGHTVYSGEETEILSSPRYAALGISDQPDIPGFRKTLSIHQQGQTDYLTFCKQSAAAGVDNWVVDTQAMTCSYFDKNGVSLLVEKIPAL